MAEVTGTTHLWNRDFRLLASGLLISYLGDAFFSIGFIWVALTLTGDPLVVGTVLALEGLPPLLLGPFAGTFVDAWNKRRIMLIGDAARGVIVLMVFLLYWAGALPIWVLYVCTLALGLCDLVYKPSLRILVPSLVDNADLPAANSFVQGSQQLALVVGASLAGMVVARYGAGPTMVVDAASFFVSAGALYLVRFAPQLVHSRKVTLRQVLTLTWDGLRFAFANPSLLTVLVLAFAMNLVMSPVNVIFPVYSQVTIKAGAAGFGWLSGAIGAGMLLGSVLYGVLSKGLPAWRSVSAGIAALVLGFAGLAMSVAVVPAIALTALLGLAVPFVQVPIVTQLQREVPAEMQGRIFSTFNTVSTASVPLGAALAGSALHALTPPLLMASASGGLLLVGVTLFLYRRFAVGSAVVETR